MLVTAHERQGKFLGLLVKGATYESVVDAYWLGLRREYRGESYAVGNPWVVQLDDGSVLLRCEPSAGVTDEQIVSELRFQLKNDRRISA